MEATFFIMVVLVVIHCTVSFKFSKVPKREVKFESITQATKSLKDKLDPLH